MSAKHKREADRLIREARKSLGLMGDSQQKLLRKARQLLSLTNEELASALGKSEAALIAWLAPEGAAKHRKMPESARLVLNAILSKKKAGP